MTTELKLIMVNSFQNTHTKLFRFFNWIQTLKGENCWWITFHFLTQLNTHNFQLVVSCLHNIVMIIIWNAYVLKKKSLYCVKYCSTIVSLSIQYGGKECLFFHSFKVIFHTYCSMYCRQYTFKLCMRIKTVMKMWKGSIIMVSRHVHVADLSLPQFHWSGISEKCIIWQFFDCVVAGGGVGAIIWYVIFIKWSERAAGMQLFSKVVWHEYWHFIRYS